MRRAHCIEHSAWGIGKTKCLGQKSEDIGPRGRESVRARGEMASKRTFITTYDFPNNEYPLTTN